MDEKNVRYKALIAIGLENLFSYIYFIFVLSSAVSKGIITIGANNDWIYYISLVPTFTVIAVLMIFSALYKQMFTMLAVVQLSSIFFFMFIFVSFNLIFSTSYNARINQIITGETMITVAALIICIPYILYFIWRRKLSHAQKAFEKR